MQQLRQGALAMNPCLRAYPFRAASIALLVVLGGCSAHPPEPTITNDTRTRLAQALQESGDPASAAALLDQTGKKAAQPADPLTHAAALIAAGQVDQGMKAARAAFAAHSDDLALGLEVGRLAVRSGRLVDAGEVYQQISQRHPDSVEALNGKGVVLAQQGDLNGAASTFRKGLELRPQDIPTRNNLALVMLLSGDTNLALSILEDLDRSDGSPKVKATLALARERSRVQGAGQPAPRPDAAPNPLASAPASSGESAQTVANRVAGAR
jgi:Flp pilus assembly protein TadD